MGEQKVATVSEARPGDVDRVAELHAAAFPGYFLTHMGQRFLRRYYRNFLESPGLCLVAIQGEQILGFVAGASEPGEFYRRFYRRNFPALSVISVDRWCRDRELRRQFRARLPRVRDAIGSVVRRPIGRRPPASSALVDASSASGPGGPRRADLLSIAVAEGNRGAGIADALVDGFLERLVRRGVGIVQLSVFTDNPRAVAFYERTGWTVAERSADSIVFERSID